MAKRDPRVADHLEWIGFVRPTGLVVSASALVSAGVILNRRDAEGQRLLRECLAEGAGDAGSPVAADIGSPAASAPSTDSEPALCDFRTFAAAVLGWNASPKGYVGTDDAPIPAELEVRLPDSGSVIRPDFAVRMEPARSPVRSSAAYCGAGTSPADSLSLGPPSVGPSSAGPPTPGPPTPSARPVDPPSAGAPSIRSTNQVRDRDAEIAHAKPGPEQASPWQLLVVACETPQPFDRAEDRSGRRRRAGGDLSPHSRMERLLRETGAPAGLLYNGEALRLISAPKGESSGWLDFRVADMLQTAGRPISTAMRELLGQTRLLSVGSDRRLAALLANSRKYQNDVSERLSGQVLHGLYELLRGFQTAHDASRGELLEQVLADQPEDVYRGLLTLILRLVFLLYTEERDMLPQDETFLGGYSLANLYERLRADAALHPDTMDQRYGAYAQILVLTRMVHDGARCGAMSLPPRHGALFDPDRYRFLEGRGSQVAGARQAGERIEPPLVSDGTVWRVLEKLILLDGERISYRALDVEHVGSVYETMMGFRLETANGRSVAIKAAKKHGAPATVDIEALLAQQPAKRAKWLQDRTDRKLTPKVSRAVRRADSIEALLAALDSAIDKAATPDLVPEDAMILQPSEERRRSGSHYTPRELTEPIVRTTLEPILRRLRSDGGRDLVPRPEQILELSVCDPAMGSGAFLVEACRQLGDALVEAWRAHDALPEIPPDENEIVFARRLIAQRCLYGLDRNPTAVDLAKLSLWLVTLAKDHPLTFLDHALRHGDALVGLSRKQIEAFHWKRDVAGGSSNSPDKRRQQNGTLRFQEGIESNWVRQRLKEIDRLRRCIREADENVSDWELRDLWDKANYEGGQVAFLGDLVVAAFVHRPNATSREKLRSQFAGAVVAGLAGEYRSWLEEMRDADPPLAPFHWEIEFPEVFGRDNPGFDAIVGNPPFAGKNTVAAANFDGYPDWLKQLHPQSHGNADLVAHFFRRAFNLVKDGGTFGLIATNTIAQGDTRYTGLRWICKHGGKIYNVRRRFKWPGLAAVVVSIVHVAKGGFDGSKALDGRTADDITAFLFHRGGHDDPDRLEANAGKSFQGSIVLGMGFTFDDTDEKGVATPLAEMERLLEENPRNRNVIFPYISGAEVNSNPTHTHNRHVINFRDCPLCREDMGVTWRDADAVKRREWRRGGIVPLDYPNPVAADWPDLLAIIDAKVKLDRMRDNRSSYRKFWWKHAEKRVDLYSAIEGLDQVLVISRYGQQFGFTFLPGRMIYSDSIIVSPFCTCAAFCTLQSRPHEVWARFFSSSFGDGLRYTPSDCFETFPFPANWESHAALEAAGEAYYEFRAALMVDNDEGMTKTYNRFHDPNERDPLIARLRELHAAMDRAVLDAYGWPDIPTDCEFLLDYEIDEETWGRKKKPWRYRWPDEVRDEVLARLLALNADRAAEERMAKEAR